LRIRRCFKQLSSSIGWWVMALQNLVKKVAVVAQRSNTVRLYKIFKKITSTQHLCHLITMLGLPCWMSAQRLFKSHYYITGFQQCCVWLSMLRITFLEETPLKVFATPAMSFYVRNQDPLLTDVCFLQDTWKCSQHAPPNNSTSFSTKCMNSKVWTAMVNSFYATNNQWGNILLMFLYRNEYCFSVTSNENCSLPVTVVQSINRFNNI